MNPTDYDVCACGAVKVKRATRCQPCWARGRVGISPGPQRLRRPPSLCACGAPKWRTSVLCAACRRLAVAAPRPLCEVCGRGIAKDSIRCSEHRGRYDANKPLPLHPTSAQGWRPDIVHQRLECLMCGEWQETVQGGVVGPLQVRQRGRTPICGRCGGCVYEPGGKAQRVMA